MTYTADAYVASVTRRTSVDIFYDEFTQGLEVRTRQTIAGFLQPQGLNTHLYMDTLPGKNTHLHPPAPTKPTRKEIAQLATATYILLYWD